VQTFTDEPEIWTVLADLFFLDTETQPRQFAHAARFLRDRGWGRRQVEREIIELVAPVAGANLGYLMYPVIGIWTGFATGALAEQIVRRRQLRARLPRWHFWLSDRWCRHMMSRLEWERLLDQLP
jgi:hypothetical protein